MSDFDMIEQSVECVFCAIVAGKAPANIVTGTSHTTTIVPINPVTPGHVITIPRAHVKDAKQDPEITARTMHDAAMYAGGLGDCNLVTSCGPAATQTVEHLHIHIVPRRPGDGLALPWTGQNR